jgi:hypothetical protein
MVKATSPPTLYQQDLVAWCDDTVAKLRRAILQRWMLRD